jgi:DNA (cytosine-5)-methyltransferase 1
LIVTDVVDPEAEAVDLFAGSGGWDLAAETLAIRVAGIEQDAATCRTRRAAGLRTVEGDVRNYGPANFPNARALIASPPCQTFTMAGKGAGRLAMDAILTLVSALGVRQPIDLSALDDRTGLVLEPLRWALEAIDAGRPYEWIALEQVPTVLPIWEAIATELRREGYEVVTGNLQAEQYGAPQTRKRAILIARYQGKVALPAPTHSRYHPRAAEKLDDGVKKWVSMADALGWGMTHRPYPAVAAGTASGGTDSQVIGGSGARRTIAEERAAGRWIDKRHEDGPETWNRPFDWMVGAGIAGQGRPRDTAHPSPTITGKGTAFWLKDRASYHGDSQWVLRNNGNKRTGTHDGQRVSIHEAAVLQSFPSDYPWQGSKSEQYQQVGNAIPPRLAEAVLRCAREAHVAAPPLQVAEQASLFDFLEDGAA